MTTWHPAALGGIVGAIAAGCCQEDSKDIRLSGEVTYPAYTSGQITVIASEEQSTRCNGSSTSSQNPGETIAQAVLDQPGPFNLSGTVRFVGSNAPQVILRAFLAADPATYWQCEAGAMSTLPANDGSDLTLALVAGSCPNLE